MYPFVLLIMLVCVKGDRMIPSSYSIIGCGLTQAQYTFHNISRKSYTTVKYFSKMMRYWCNKSVFKCLPKLYKC